MAKKPKVIPTAGQDLVARKIIADIEKYSMRAKNWDGHGCEALPKHICVAAGYLVSMINDFKDDNEAGRLLPTQTYHIPNMPNRNGVVEIPNSLMLGWVVQGAATLEVPQSIIFHDQYMHYADKDKQPAKIKIDELFSKELEKVKDIIFRLPTVAPLVDDDASKMRMLDDVKETSVSIGVALDKAKQEGTIYGI